MYKELESDIPGFVRPPHGFLIGWAKQGKFSILKLINLFRLNEANQFGYQVKFSPYTHHFNSAIFFINLPLS